MRTFMHSYTTALIYKSIILHVLTYGIRAKYGAALQFIKTKIVSLENRAQIIIGREYSTALI